MTRRKRTASSQRWLARQRTDPFVRRARAEGYRARSVYKLEEIDRRFRLLGKGRRVVDLGAAPGSWSQYAAARGCRVVALDRLEMAPIEGVTFIRGDFLDEATQERVRQACPGGVDLVLSDLAPDTTGQRAVDRLRSEAAAEAVVEFASEVLRPGGDLLVKLLRGAEAAVAARARPFFSRIRFLRPEATRRESSETYLLAQSYREPEAARAPAAADEPGESASS